MAGLSSLTQRIQRLTEDLRHIEMDLGPTADFSNSELPPVEVLQDFKCTVDHIRHVLWGFVESHSNPEDIAASIQSIRMQRVTKMLRALNPAVQESVSIPEAQSFFAEIQMIANHAMDAHRGEGDQVSRASA
jgi:hypothetical protein